MVIDLTVIFVPWFGRGRSLACILTINIDDLGLVVASLVSNSNLLADCELTALPNATTDNRLLDATVAGRLKPANRHETHVDDS